MKVKAPSLIIATVLSALLGAVCYLIAPDSDNRQWFSLGVGFATILMTFIPAIALDFSKGRRSLSIKVVAWVGLAAVVSSNMIFSALEYKIETYVIITALIAFVSDALVYALYKS